MAHLNDPEHRNPKSEGEILGPRDLETRVEVPEAYAHGAQQEARGPSILYVPQWKPSKPRWATAILLFLLTLTTTTVIGARLEDNFLHNRPAWSSDSDYLPFVWALSNWHNIVLGLPFSATLLGILFAHEMGHYVFARRNRVDCTLPYFIPAPTLIGTMGAFIRIKSPIWNRRALFDIGISGPIAGFVVAVPLLAWSLTLSKPVPIGMGESDVQFSFPLIFTLMWKAVQALGFSNVKLGLEDLMLHPTAIAAWVGMFATSLNLLPGGQLDGGHIIYALAPRWHRPLSQLLVSVLLVCGVYFWTGWLIWALFLLFFALRHPPVPMNPGIDSKRKWWAAFALLMFLMTLVVAPFPDKGLIGVLQSR